MSLSDKFKRLCDGAGIMLEEWGFWWTVAMFTFPFLAVAYLLASERQNRRTE